MCYKTQLYLSFVIFGQIGASGQYFTNLKLEFMYIVRSALKSETSFNLCFKVGFWGQNRLEAATVHCKCLQGFTGTLQGNRSVDFLYIHFIKIFQISL